MIERSIDLLVVSKPEEQASYRARVEGGREGPINGNQETRNCYNGLSITYSQVQLDHGASHACTIRGQLGIRGQGHYSMSCFHVSKDRDSSYIVTCNLVCTVKFRSSSHMQLDMIDSEAISM